MDGSTAFRAQFTVQYADYLRSDMVLPFVIAIYRNLDDVTILPVTAYEVPEQRPKKGKRRR